MTEHTSKTYGTMRFAVKEGVYTLEELEKLLAHCREMKYRSDDHLEESMGKPHKEFRDRIGMMPIEDAIRIFGRNA